MDDFIEGLVMAIRILAALVLMIAFMSLAFLGPGGLIVWVILVMVGTCAYRALGGDGWEVHL